MQYSYIIAEQLQSITGGSSKEWVWTRQAKNSWFSTCSMQLLWAGFLCCHKQSWNLFICGRTSGEGDSRLKRGGSVWWHSCCCRSLWNLNIIWKYIYFIGSIFKKLLLFNQQKLCSENILLTLTLTNVGQGRKICCSLPSGKAKGE